MHHERELSLSNRQSRLIEIGEINTTSPAIFLSWTAWSRHKLSIATLARYSRPSRSQGTSSSTIKRMPFARAAGFDDSIGRMHERCNLMKYDNRAVWGKFLLVIIEKKKRTPLLSLINTRPSMSTGSFLAVLLRLYYSCMNTVLQNILYGYVQSIPDHSVRNGSK